MSRQSTLLDFTKAGYDEQAQNDDSDASPDVSALMMTQIVCTPCVQLRLMVYQLTLLRVKNSHLCNLFVGATLEQCLAKERMPEIEASVITGILFSHSLSTLHLQMPYFVFHVGFFPIQLHLVSKCLPVWGLRDGNPFTLLYKNIKTVCPTKLA